MKSIINSRLKTWLNLIIGITLFSVFLLLGSSAHAQFTWPVYEPFSEYPESYANTNDATLALETNAFCLGDDVSSNFWNFGNPNQNWQVTNSAALSWPALVGDPSPTPAGVQEIPENTTSADVGATFTQQFTNIYCSFLLDYQNNGGATANRCVLNIVSNAVAQNSDTHFFTSVWLAPDYGIVIDKNDDSGGAFSTESPALVTNAPNLIVVSYKIVPGGNDIMSLWVNPPGLGSDSLMPPPTVTTTNGANMTGWNGVMLSQRKTPNYQENVFQVDELRLGSDWASVTPATASPGPFYAVTGGGTACPGVSLHVGLNGSASSNTYLLYTNGAYSGISLNGTGSALDFGLQSTPAAYTVLATNATTTAVGWMTNSVTLAAIPAPIITIEPNPVITANNNRAEFKVVAAGTGFSYQWYQDGVALANTTNITGALTNDLVIWPATTLSIGNYYCVIGNTCGNSSDSTTNSLTLDSPNNLTWAGDFFGINAWTFGATAVQEFTSGGSGAYFNEGDNVTFNDTYNGAQFGTNINMTNILTPTSITFTTSQPLAFVGPGILEGTASLLVNEAGGVLTILNNSAGSYANTFSGGTTISAGQVNIPNSWASIGTGPLTLAGGTFETDQKSSGTGGSLGFPTNITVTANSTWQVDKTGNQCAGLAAALLGNSGITLTITNSATTTKSANEIRFNGAFTNGLSFVTSENVLATNSFMQIGSFNASGTIQVYNGSISGPTASFFASGAGSVYLNGANTYTNPTYITAGFLAGSGSIAGPLNVSSNTTVGAGSISSIGTFSVGMGMIMTNGAKVLIRVNKALTQSNDVIAVTGGVITNAGPATTGIVTMTNIGTAPLAVGDTFQIFNQPVQNGATFTVTGGGNGVTWINNLAVNGSVQVATVFVSLTTSPGITGFSLQKPNGIFSATNGTAGATAYLLTSTNLLLPLNQWHSVATDVLSGASFTVTNPITTTSPAQFFIFSSTNYNP